MLHISNTIDISSSPLDDSNSRVYVRWWRSPDAPKQDVAEMGVLILALDARTNVGPVDHDCVEAR